MSSNTSSQDPKVYDGDGDQLMQKEHADLGDRVILVPDSLPSKTAELGGRIRIMWGQHMLDDLLAGRYRSLVCAVNTEDNSHGIIAQLAKLLPTSQWDDRTITEYARQFNVGADRPRVLKYDMDMVEVLAILRPANRRHLTIGDLKSAFKIIGEMVSTRPYKRVPTASVSFLGARANVLRDDEGNEPPFETVLRTMYEAGYYGDVYPSPAMWHVGNTAVFARYPFSPALDEMRHGGF